MKIRKESFFLYTFVFILLFPYIKILADLVIGEYKIVTVLTYPVLLLISLVLVYKGNTRFNAKYIWFVVYIGFISVVSVLTEESTIISAASSSLRFVIMILMTAYVMGNCLTNIVSKKIYKLFLIYFLFTVFVCFLQVIPQAPLHFLFTNFGGNIVSGTILGNTRANGGIGGTVIGYSGFIVLNFIVLLISENLYTKKEKIIYFVSILIASVLNYSRATFLGLITLFIGYVLIYILNKKSIFRSSFMFAGLSFIAIWMLTTDIEIISYMFQNDQYRQLSDQTRINSTLYGLSQMNSIYKIFCGISVGQNTGFTTDQKLQTDSAFFSFLFDYGFIGIVLLTLFTISLIVNLYKIKKRKKDKKFILIIFTVFCLIYLINGSMIENLNMLVFPYIIGLLKCFATKKEEMIKR